MHEDFGAGEETGPLFFSIVIKCRSFLWITEYYYMKKMKP